MSSIKRQSKPTALGIQPGDLVRVLTGDDRGKQGTVLRVLPRVERVVVEGMNVVTKHVRPTPKAPHGGRLQRPNPIRRANVALICPHCSRLTRRTLRRTEGSTVAVCRRCHEAIVGKERA